MRMPMFGFLLLGFLLFAAIVAVACYLVFKSGEQGKTKLSGCAGCAIGLGLLSFAGLGALGCTAIAILDSGNEAVRHGPIKSFEWRWPQGRHDRDAHADEHGRDTHHGESSEGESSTDGSGGDESNRDESDPNESHPFELRVVVRGSADYAVAGQISRWLHEQTDADVSVRTRVRIQDGEEVTELEFGLPLSDEELAEIRRNFERDVSGLPLPEGVRVEMKSPHED
jgi:hypothetical protein